MADNYRFEFYLSSNLSLVVVLSFVRLVGVLFYITQRVIIMHGKSFSFYIV